MNMKLEVVVIPVTDADRAMAFYESLGWRLDADFSTGDAFRVVQLTPPGSGASIIFGTGASAGLDVRPGPREWRSKPRPPAFFTATDPL